MKVSVIGDRFIWSSFFKEALEKYLSPIVGKLTCADDGCGGVCGDCGAVCGDDNCTSSEDCASCEADCGVCPTGCGDGTCAATESTTTCASDCWSPRASF